jgi:hypothetical protein
MHQGRFNGGIDARQKCVVKMQYSNSPAAHRVQLEKYLVREGTDRDGSRAKLYGSDLEEYRKNMVDKNFRIFLSPQSKEVDLTDLSTRFVKKLEAATGYKLWWQAANHYNTAHPHAHLLINGVDRSGKEVIFPPDVVKTFMREMAREICTSQIGMRTHKDLEIERERQLTAPRRIRLDARIKELCGGGSRVNLAAEEKDRERILARLEFLRKLKLCTYKDGGYRLAPRWEDDLAANGRYNVFLKAREALPLPAALRVYSGADGFITGRVFKVYRTDEDASDNHAVLIETRDGRAFFIPLFRAPEITDRNGKRPVQEGETLSVTPRENQRGRLTPVFTEVSGGRQRS